MRTRIEESWVGTTLVEMRWYQADDLVETESLQDDPTMEELERSRALALSMGLEAEARAILGEMAFVSYLKQPNRNPEEDYGSPLTRYQFDILNHKFGVSYRFGYEGRVGDIRAHHMRKGKRHRVVEYWYQFAKPYRKQHDRRSTRRNERLWDTYDFERIPFAVMEKIDILRRDPLVRELVIMTPQDVEVSDPVLVARCYRIGDRLVARWAEALEPIKGIDDDYQKHVPEEPKSSKRRGLFGRS